MVSLPWFRRRRGEPETLALGDLRLYRLMEELDREAARRRVVALTHGKEPSPAEAPGHERNGRPHGSEP